MVSEAQKRAVNKYRREKTKHIMIRFYPNEVDEKIYRQLKSQDNTTAYLKRLVLEDIETAVQ